MLAKPEADLRQELGERAEWLNGAKLVARDETSVTFSVWNAHQGNNIRQHCGATILKVTSASRLDFVVERPAAANRRQR